MIFTPSQLGSVALDKPTLSVDKKFCKKYGPCGVGDKALYLNSFYFDRWYYVALTSVRRVFKRVAMSKGGFSGKGLFGAIPYLVVELDDGTSKQCNFKWEQDVDMMIAHISRLLPDIPTHSVEAERRLREKQEREEARYLKELTPKAQQSREELEKAKTYLASFPEQTTRLAAAAKAKRINERTNPAYRWVALAIIVAGIIWHQGAGRRRQHRPLLPAAGLCCRLPVFRCPGAPHRPKQQKGRHRRMAVLHRGHGKIDPR